MSWSLTFQSESIRFFIYICVNSMLRFTVTTSRFHFSCFHNPGNNPLKYLPKVYVYVSSCMSLFLTTWKQRRKKWDFFFVCFFITFSSRIFSTCFRYLVVQSRPKKSTIVFIKITSFFPSPYFEESNDKNMPGPPAKRLFSGDGATFHPEFMNIRFNWFLLRM